MEYGGSAPDFGVMVRASYQFPEISLYSDLDLMTGSGYLRTILGVALRL